jgi:hypothetical protein
MFEQSTSGRHRDELHIWNNGFEVFQKGTVWFPHCFIVKLIVRRKVAHSFEVVGPLVSQMCSLKTSKRVPNEELGNIDATEFLIYQIEKVDTIFPYLIPRLYHSMLSISWISTESKVPLVKPTEIIASICKVLSKVTTASTVFSIAMHEKDNSLSFFGLTRISIVLKCYKFLVCFLHSN